MRKAQDKLLDELWSKRASGLPFDTQEEALILASIVEKETGVPEERARVAAVFREPSAQGMRLQSDPTVVYGITVGKRKLDRPILKADIDAKNPYNTYQIAGLPPTPIANPGREAIVAVLNPVDTGEFYFVADGTGGHIFAKSLDEHNRNVAKWRVIERTEKAKAEAAPVNASGRRLRRCRSTPAPRRSCPRRRWHRSNRRKHRRRKRGCRALGACSSRGGRAHRPHRRPSSSPEPEVLKPGSVVKVAGKLIRDSGSTTEVAIEASPRRRLTCRSRIEASSSAALTRPRTA